MNKPTPGGPLFVDMHKPALKAVPVVRKALKAAFPDVVFTVNREETAVRVIYTDGPSLEHIRGAAIEAIAAMGVEVLSFRPGVQVYREWSAPAE